ncbi:MAG: histidinol dehydrogenase [Candidatus Hydrogenedentes bacterium]|nr:histidinol dehydrogenase [Candidatus Hydrogenedentota bacterium]
MMRKFHIKSDEDLLSTKKWIADRTNSALIDENSNSVLDTVKWIIEMVRKSGDEAIVEFTERFDGVILRPEQFEVPKEEIIKCFNLVDPRLLKIIEKSAENIRKFHSKNLRNSWEETYEDGTVIGQKVTPIEKVGVYVPGGKAFYPSSVLMNIIPAKIAGVKEIIMVSPPSYNGTIHPVVLASAQIAGVDRIFKIGGAQAIAALAYGTKTVPSVEKITGPGNIYVTIAKSLVRGIVEIDCEAGPSEVVVVADKTANPKCVASEILAQAEHDEKACCVLITVESESEIVAKVESQIKNLISSLPRKEIIEKSLTNYGAIIIARDWDELVEIINYFAPEHLNIQTELPRKIESRVRNAGAIMLGTMTPVAVGDYMAGPNHILPTGRRARFSSPLTTEDFRKVTNYIYYSRARLFQESEDIVRFAEAEGLTAHAMSIKLRTSQGENANE